MIAPQPNPFTGEVDYEGPSESTYDTEEDLSAQDLVSQRNLNVEEEKLSSELISVFWSKFSLVLLSSDIIQTELC